jgi:predicted metal-dependent phosphoesterase TrpH
LLKADLHVHTRYSPDSISSPGNIVQRCLDIGINCLAITDHNSIAGALETKRIAPFKVIVGEEILTDCGEIIGYFLTEEIPPHLTPEETVKRIKNQGGLVCIPHPCDSLRPQSRLQRRALERIMSQVDLIEVYNSRTMLLKDSAHALQLAQQNRLPGTAGSDAHVVQEVGRSYIELPDFNDAEQFRKALAQGRITGNRTSIFIHFYNIRNRLFKLLKRG